MRKLRAALAVVGLAVIALSLASCGGGSGGKEGGTLTGTYASFPSYLDPAVFNAECDRSPLPELSAPALWFGFDGLDQLVILRDFVMSQAAQAVVDVTQFLQAVYSVATNAIEYGGASEVVRACAPLWLGACLPVAPLRGGVGRGSPDSGAI